MPENRYACRIRQEGYPIEDCAVYAIKDYWEDTAASSAVERYEYDTCEFPIAEGRQEVIVDVWQLAEGLTEEDPAPPTYTSFSVHGWMAPTYLASRIRPETRPKCEETVAIATAVASLETL